MTFDASCAEPTDAVFHHMGSDGPKIVRCRELLVLVPSGCGFSVGKLGKFVTVHGSVFDLQTPDSDNLIPFAPSISLKHRILRLGAFGGIHSEETRANAIRLWGLHADFEFLIPSQVQFIGCWRRFRTAGCRRKAAPIGCHPRPATIVARAKAPLSPVRIWQNPPIRSAKAFVGSRCRMRATFGATVLKSALDAPSCSCAGRR